MFSRHLKDTISRAIATFPAVVVTGPRQSGKTTLLRSEHGGTHRYVSLEDPDIRARAIEDPRGFLRDNPPPIILDEIQHTPSLLPYIETLIDEDRTPGRWFMTGSQNFSLMAGVTESLAGRAAVLTLLPLTFSEWHPPREHFASIEELLQEVFTSDPPPPTTRASLGDWIVRGAYPELRATPEADRRIWCSSYIQTYLERDVRQFLNVGEINTFHRFLRLTAARTGQLLNIADLARDTGVSAPTARRWLCVLEAGGLVYLLQPYFKNFGKRLVKSPKLYWLDTGLATFLTGIHNVEAAMKGPMAGPLFETAIVASWVKAFLNRGLPPPLSFWRTRNGVEVDLLIDHNSVLYAMEMKSTSTVTPTHAASLRRWRKISDSPDAPAVVVAAVDDSFHLTDGIRAVPWWGM